MCDDHPALNFAGYTFHGDKGCFTCSHVWKGGAPVLLFVHDVDGDIQFMCGEAGHDADEDCIYLHAHHILDAQPDLYDLPTVDFGFQAERTSVGQPWEVSELPEYDED
jgi:hypothetical protein